MSDSESAEETSVAALAPARREEGTNLMRPAASPTDIAEAFQQYQQVRSQILEQSDFQSAGRDQFLKRSGWRKLSTAFGVTFQLVDRTIERDDSGGILRAEFTTRAVAPNGRAVDGWGACDVFERCCEPGCNNNHRHCAGQNGWHAHADAWTHFSKAEHDIPSTAETRSKNRAAADLFGMGEVSAEEMQGVHPPPQQQQQAPPQQPQSGGGENLASEPQQRKIRATCNDDPQVSDEALHWAIQQKYGVESTQSLTKKQASELIEKLSDSSTRQKIIDGYESTQSSEDDDIEDAEVVDETPPEDQPL